MDEKEELKKFVEDAGVSEEELAFADTMFRIYMLLQGKDWEGKPYWAYLAIPPSRVPEFQAARRKADNAFVNYGDVLQFGYGEYPPKEIQEAMEVEFGIRHDFENQIKAAAEKKQERSKTIDKYSGKKTKKDDENNE